LEFAALALLALILGFRGLRAGRQTYLLSAGAAAIAAVYTYHWQ